jgi:hypothetical protein
MKKFRVAIACVVAMVYGAMLLANVAPVHAAPVTVSTDQAFYPIWGVGGTVRITAQNLIANVTYYVWLRGPKQLVSNFTKLSFTSTTGVSILLTMSPVSPPGTYLLSLSTSDTSDTQEATAHFGVIGTNSGSYERTETATIAGGGFAPNSTIVLSIDSASGALPGFPLNLTTLGSGEFSYDLKLPPSTPTGSLTASVRGLTYDTRELETVNSPFVVTLTTVRAKSLKAPAAQVERTAAVTSTYQLSYPDGSPVTGANATASVILAGQRLFSVPLILINSSSGEWQAKWTPSPSAKNTTYHFQFNPTNFTDSYGNKGQGPTLTSSTFNVVPVNLLPVIQPNQTLQRTQESIINLSATYPNGAGPANITRANVAVTESAGGTLKVVPTLNGTEALAHFRIPVNATLGNWTVSYNIEDSWGNSGSGKLIVRVLQASPIFLLQTPPTAERSTFLIVTSRVSYPDGSPFTSTINLVISHGNLTWTPKLNFNSTTLTWSGSYYLAPNASPGQYNITWTAHDGYGNAGSIKSATLVGPAQFSFVLKSNNSTVDAFTELDLPVRVTYPNGTSLTNNFGNVTASYKNATGTLFTIPLAYNETNATWQMFFPVPEQGNITFSFNATDRFGNAGTAADAYKLKIIPAPAALSERLLIAAVVGVLIPIGLLAWAVATISTRRRKHRP